MELTGVRTLVVGGTGALGGKLVRALHEAGARSVVTGRSTDRLAALDGIAEGTVELDLLDVAACREAVARAADTLGGLDLVVVASGVAGFGSAAETPDAVTEELFAVNAFGPIAVLSAAVPVMSAGGTLVALSAILADAPMAQMAAYSASKAALTAWLTALRLEQRRHGRTVFDIRPPHVDTGLAGRAVAGEAPPLTAAVTAEEVVRRVVDGIRDGRRELSYDLSAKEFRTR